MKTKYVNFGDEACVHIHAGNRTACGLPLLGEYLTGTEAGPLPVCTACKDRDPDATAQEIVETIEKHVAGFEADAGESPPQYLNHSQLVALKDEIERIKET